jgi:hypothetical protein
MAGVGQKPKIGLIFCEDENDAESLKNIAKAVRPTLPRIDYCRKPLILVRDMKKAEDRKKNAANVLAAVRAREVLSTVQFVIAHQDCDDFEPAHVQLAIRIKGFKALLPRHPLGRSKHGGSCGQRLSPR